MRLINESYNISFLFVGTILITINEIMLVLCHCQAATTPITKVITKVNS